MTNFILVASLIFIVAITNALAAAFMIINVIQGR